MPTPEDYKLDLGNYSWPHREKLLDDGTPEQIETLDRFLQGRAETPHSADPVVTNPSKKRLFIPKLYEGPIQDAYIFTGFNTTDATTRLSMVFEFPNGYELEVLKPKVALKNADSINFESPGKLKMDSTFVGGLITDFRVGILGQVFLRVQRERQVVTLVSDQWSIAMPYLDLALSKPLSIR